MSVNAGAAAGRVGIVGGTGAFGQALAVRLALAGESVVISGRDRSRSVEAAQKLVERYRLTDASISGTTLDEAFEAQIVVVCVPFTAVDSTIGDRSLPAESVVVTAVNQIERSTAGPRFVGVTSVAERISATLPKCGVATAFNHIPAKWLRDLDAAFEADVFVAATDERAADAAARLVRCVQGLRPVAVGSLESARCIEEMTTVVLRANKSLGHSNALRLMSASQEQDFEGRVQLATGGQ